MLWDILMKLFMSLNKSFIHPSLDYLSKMNAPCISFHSSAFRDVFKEELWNNQSRMGGTQTMSISVRAHSSLGREKIFFFSFLFEDTDHF